MAKDETPLRLSKALSEAEDALEKLRVCLSEQAVTFDELTCRRLCDEIRKEHHSLAWQVLFRYVHGKVGDIYKH